MIHPTAIVSAKAVLATGVSVGPYTIIGDGVSIGRGTRVASHAVITGDTRIGEDNEFGTGCVIGADAQIKAEHASGGLVIGSRNIIREYATIHGGGKADSRTVIGDSNYLMAGIHVAHDCRLDNHIVIANGTQLSGHVEIEDHVFISGLVGVHQFVRVGTHAMVGGITKLVADVIPYSLCDGNPAQVRGANAVGLKRSGFTQTQIRSVKEAVQTLYFSKRLRTQTLQTLESQAAGSPEARRILDFIRASRRGILPKAARE